MSGDGWLRGVQWGSREAQAEWADRLEAAAAAWEELELVSVTSGVRQSALVFLEPEELVTATADSANVGLQVVPLAYDPATRQTRAAVCMPHRVQEWIRAWRSSDHHAIGELLGFPRCCVKAFAQTWGRGVRDTTFGMFERRGTATGPAPANILLRRLGVRLVPHLPCAFDCEATVALARRMAEAGRIAGIEDVDQIEALLALPMTWDAIGGAATVQVGSLFRFAYETDQGDPRKFMRTGAVPALEPPPWRDNGFSSRAAMDAAHRVIAGVAVVGSVSSAIDFGAGDGALLDLIARASASPALQPWWTAIEMDQGRAARGRRRRPRIRFFHGRITEWAPVSKDPADVALLMPGRMIEMGALERQVMAATLPTIARRLVVYAYGDTLTEQGLAQLFHEAGIPGRLGTIRAGAGVQAAEVSWH